MAPLRLGLGGVPRRGQREEGEPAGAFAIRAARRNKTEEGERLGAMGLLDNEEPLAALRARGAVLPAQPNRLCLGARVSGNQVTEMPHEHCGALMLRGCDLLILTRARIALIRAARSRFGVQGRPATKLGGPAAFKDHCGAGIYRFGRG